MEVRSFSKSGYQLFRKCPYLCDQVRNKKLTRKVGPGAYIGREVHRLWHRINTKQLDPEIAADLASNEEVAGLITQTLKFGVDDSEFRQYYHELKISLQGFSCKVTLILDHVSVHWMSTLVSDLKTGWDETPDIAEMIIYALGANENWPGREYVLFRYLWARTGHITTYIFRWLSPYHVRMLGPNNFQLDLISTDGRDPLRAKVQSYITEMEQSDARATPGPHCEMMWGEPCQLLGNGCPLSPDLADTFSAPMPGPEQELIAANIMRLPEDKRPGVAFILIKNGYPIKNLPANVIGYAAQGLMQVRGGADHVAAAIREWAYPDRTYSIGEGTYGWRPARVTDVKHALELLVARGVPTEDLAKVVSISKSSLQKLPKRKYGQLGTQIADACVYYAEGKEFGKL
jgi:hypothetical protein